MGSRYKRWVENRRGGFPSRRLFFVEISDLKIRLTANAAFHRKLLVTIPFLRGRLGDLHRFIKTHSQPASLRVSEGCKVRRSVSKFHRGEGVSVLVVTIIKRAASWDQVYILKKGLGVRCVEKGEAPGT